MLVDNICRCGMKAPLLHAAAQTLASVIGSERGVPCLLRRCQRLDNSRLLKTSIWSCVWTSLQVLAVAVHSLLVK